MDFKGFYGILWDLIEFQGILRGLKEFKKVI